MSIADIGEAPSTTHLEQQLTQLQQENTQLQTQVNGLRAALRYVIDEANGVFTAIERQTEAGRHRLDRTLTREFTDTRLINELVRDSQAPSPNP